MKKNLLFSLMAACALTFTACSDDDDPMISPSDLSTTFGTDGTTSLNLSYSDSPISGKQVKFHTKDSKTASITLMDVIPGQAEAVIDNIKLTEAENEYIFSGASAITRATGYTVNYSGSVKKGELTLKLNVTVPDPQGWAKNYALGDYSLSDDQKKITTSPLYINAIPEEKDAGITRTFRAVGALILPQLLHSVTLESDGNIRASYSSLPFEIDMSAIIGVLFGSIPSVKDIQNSIPTNGWVDSPKNLAYWFEKDGKLYIKLNIASIISQANSDNATEDDGTLSTIINTLLNSDVATIKATLSSLGIDAGSISDASFEMILSWIKNGIPLNVETIKGQTHIFLDKEALNPLFVSQENNPNTSDIVKLWNILMRMNLIPEDAQMAGTVFQGIAGAWPNLTTFSLGLDLQ